MLSASDDVTYYKVVCPDGYKLEEKSGNKFACVDSETDKQKLSCKSGYDYTINLVDDDKCKMEDKKDVECSSGYSLTIDYVGKDSCKKSEVEYAECPSGYTQRVSSLGKDKCQKVDTDVESPKCDLKIGEFQSNWDIVKVSGNDYCEHEDKSSKGIRSLKCESNSYGVQVDYSGNTDKCVNESELIEKDITCPSGYDHKVSGTDTCEKTSKKDPTCDSGYDYNTNPGKDNCKKEDSYIPSCESGYTKSVAGEDRCKLESTEDHKPKFEKQD